ncbi:uncharacterized protein [Lolium perenne]|jgi:hypothetical protein|uniref:uncharacterized protein n=1 Tax=Lolium perenne TaxID=4522 RepID=UPI0021EB33F8
MAAGDDGGRKSWTAGDYILAALGGCVAATAIVIIVSVVFSPGRIIFSITHASHKKLADGDVNLRLTIIANNTSHRAKVRFLSFSVVLINSSSSNGPYTTDAPVVDPTFPSPNATYLLEPTTMSITASVHLVAGDILSYFTGQRLESDSAGFTVVLRSQVRFWIGKARTKIFDVRVSCPGVKFVQDRHKSRAQKPVQCYG